ncbi:hypothetical protein [Streptomyces sp. NPDC018833]|uniref:hypothetical protein n=1 Tax=Streptomyces sp. NPDC018833 TaxID=3365053 RepID=UPI0037BC5C53
MGRADTPCGHRRARAGDARHGLAGHLSPKLVSAGDVVALLMEHIMPAMEAADDTHEVMSLVHRLLQQGTPADRQQRAK